MSWICVDCGKNKKSKKGDRCTSCAGEKTWRDRDLGNLIPETSRCQDCGNPVKTRYAVRCSPCSRKSNGIAKRKPKKECPECGKELSDRRAALCLHCTMIKRWEDGGFQWTPEQIEVKKQALENARSAHGWKDGQAARMKKRWIDGEFDSEEYRQLFSDTAKATWENDDFREKMTRLMKERWADKEYREHMEQAIVQSHQRGDFDGVHHNPSKLSMSVDSALRRAGFDTVTEFRVGGYSYDVYVPVLNLLIEVDGEYWHHSEMAIEKGVPDTDLRKTARAEQEGYALLRLREKDLQEHGIGFSVEQVLKWRRAQ